MLTHKDSNTFSPRKHANTSFIKQLICNILNTFSLALILLTITNSFEWIWGHCDTINIIQRTHVGKCCISFIYKRFILTTYVFPEREKHTYLSLMLKRVLLLILFDQRFSRNTMFSTKWFKWKSKAARKQIKLWANSWTLHTCYTKCASLLASDQFPRVEVNFCFKFTVEFNLNFFFCIFSVLPNVS